MKDRLSGVKLSMDLPNGQLDEWEALLGDLKVPKKTEGKEQEEPRPGTFETKTVSLSADNLLLRGSELRNSDWIYGLVVYVGFDCKIYMNNQSRKLKKKKIIIIITKTLSIFILYTYIYIYACIIHLFKRSSVEKQMNRYIYCMALAQLLICILCAVLSGLWQDSNTGAWYLDVSSDVASGATLKFFTWFIIFAQFIPISLLVSMEMVKYFQAFFMQWDMKMYTRLHGKQDKFCNVQNSGLNEDLGQIQYVFSDKTGTLTENSLDFRKCFIAEVNFGRGETEIARAANRKKEEIINIMSISIFMTTVISMI
ncbi:hypothetical protein RFI_23961, partial [Reticulomyxa filosa]